MLIRRPTAMFIDAPEVARAPTSDTTQFSLVGRAERNGSVGNR